MGSNVRSASRWGSGLYKALTLSALSWAASPSVCLAEPVTVHVKNGGQAGITGEMIEYIPGDHLTLEVGDKKPKVKLRIASEDVVSIETARDTSVPVTTPGVEPAAPYREPAPLRQTGAVRGSQPVHYAGHQAPMIEGLRFYGGFHVDVIGKGKFKGDDDGESFYDKSKVDPTPGFQLGAGYVWRHFGIGGELRMNWLRFKGDADREKLIDLVAKPRVSYPLRGLPLELYAALPLGLSIPKIKDDDDAYKVGLAVGLMFGASYFFTEDLAVNFETGWIMHRYKATDDTVDATVTINQFSLINLNMAYALAL